MAQVEDYQARKMTLAEYNEFHSIDRDLYATLVYDLWRDPIEAIQMMAIWIWLEKMCKGFPEISRRILSLPFHFINKLGDEALLCWACIDNISLLFSASVMDFPLTTILLKNEIPIDYFRNFRELSISGINEVITVVCANYFKDIWDGAIARNAHMNILQCMAKLDHSATSSKKIKVQPDERTLFVTFSRGYPVAEWEVRELFNGLFGDCIESFYMQEVGAGEQALFAKIVLKQLSYIHAVLSGGTKAKFTINGKHVWMRKFIPRVRRR